jgi:hypothetical protein
MEITNSSSETSAGILTVLRRPSVGPLLIGLLVGGIPSGFLLAALGISGRWDDIFFRWLTPVAIFVSVLGAVLPQKSSPARLLCQSLITSFSACFAIPTIVWTVLAWREGLEILYVANLPYIAILFTLWSLVVAVMSWLIAMVFTFLKKKYSRAEQSHAMQ